MISHNIKGITGVGADTRPLQPAISDMALNGLSSTNTQPPTHRYNTMDNIHRFVEVK